jgi:hypothetical protein
MNVPGTHPNGCYGIAGTVQEEFPFADYYHWKEGWLSVNGMSLFLLVLLRPRFCQILLENEDTTRLVFSFGSLSAQMKLNP